MEKIMDDIKIKGNQMRKLMIILTLTTPPVAIIAAALIRG